MITTLKARHIADPERTRAAILAAIEAEAGHLERAAASFGEHYLTLRRIVRIDPILAKAIVALRERLAAQGYRITWNRTPNA